MGAFLVFLAGEVLGLDDDVDLALLLRLISLWHRALPRRLLDDDGRALCGRQGSQVDDEHAQVTFLPLDGVEHGDVLAIGVRLVLSYAHPAVLNQELRSRVRHRLLV